MRHPGDRKATQMESLEKAGLAVNYNKVKSTKPKSLPEKVYIWDETLRDGEQTPGVALTVEEKIEIAKMLDEVGVSIVVVGYPAVSEAEKQSVARIVREGLSHAVIGAPARAMISDIDACIDSGVKEVPIFLATSDFRLRYQLRESADTNRTLRCSNSSTIRRPPRRRMALATGTTVLR